MKISDKMRILLVGGTKESLDVIKFIKNNYNDSYILTTTTTEYGSKLALNSGSDKVIGKPLLKDEFIKLSSGFDLILDITHPYASHITKTLIEVSKINKIPYIRYERPSLDISKIENINLNKIHHVNSFYECRLLIEKEFSEDKLLNLTGINNAEELLKSVSIDNYYIRILKIKSSIEKAKSLNIKEDHIFPMTASSNKNKKISIEENKKLFEKIKPNVIVTKESGKTGGFIEKIIGANELGINIIIIDRPHIDLLKNQIIVKNIEELENKINETLK